MSIKTEEQMTKNRKNKEGISIIILLFSVLDRML
jgi:hypothetical protein